MDIKSEIKEKEEDVFFKKLNLIYLEKDVIQKLLKDGDKHLEFPSLDKEDLDVLWSGSWTVKDESVKDESVTLSGQR